MTLAYLPLMVLFGYLGYRESSRFRASSGRSPWGWPPLLWGLCTATSLLFGGVLLLVARRTSRSGPVTNAPLPTGSEAPGTVYTSQTILPHW